MQQVRSGNKGGNRILSLEPLARWSLGDPGMELWALGPSNIPPQLFQAKSKIPKKFFKEML